MKEIKSDKKNTGKTITLVRVVDLAKLVRLVPLKRMGLDTIRGLFVACTTPEQAREWIDRLEKIEVSKFPYREILETIWKLQDERPSEAVEYAAVVIALDKNQRINIPKEELVEACGALARIAPWMISARRGLVEMSQRPDKVLDAIKVVIQEYPEKEQLTIQV